MTGERLRELDDGAVLPPLRRLLGDREAQLFDWRSEPLHGGTSPSSLLRVAGLADVGGRRVPFSFVVKQVSRSDEAERSWGYWRREPALYASRLLDDLPGVRAPRCYGVEENEHGARIWLEEVVSSGGWSIERYANVALLRCARPTAADVLPLRRDCAQHSRRHRRDGPARLGVRRLRRGRARRWADRGWERRVLAVRRRPPRRAWRSVLRSVSRRLARGRLDRRGSLGASRLLPGPRAAVRCLSLRT
jgi:hypothetical protein